MASINGSHHNLKFERLVTTQSDVQCLPLRFTNLLCVSILNLATTRHTAYVILMNMKRHNRTMHALNGNMVNYYAELGEVDLDEFFEDSAWDDLGTQIEEIVTTPEFNDLVEFEKYVKEVEYEDTHALDFATEDILDILGSDMFIRGRYDNFEFLKVDPVSIEPQLQILQSKGITTKRITSTSFNILTMSGWVYVSDGAQMIKVGRCNDKVQLNYSRYTKDYVEIAAKYSEHTKSKGTCLGYSSLIHLAAVLAMAKPNSVIEPHEGYDFHDGTYSYEITGFNWMIRDTVADVVINKYDLIAAVCSTKENIELMDMSIKEDLYDSSGFVKSSFDQERSPYSDVIDDLHALTRTVPVTMMRQFSNQLIYWLSKQQPEFDDEAEIEPIGDMSMQLELGAKRNMLPAPYRVEYSPIRTEFPPEFYIRPYISDSSIGTTYHTFEVDRDPTDSLLEFTNVVFTNPMSTHYQVPRWIFEAMMKTRLFNSVYVESELLSKISGGGGYFWSDYSNVGITWCRTKSRSSIYYIAYYSMSPPAEDGSCGHWVQRNGLWLSPTVKISIVDINYGILLPWRFLNQINSILAYSTKDRGPIIYKLLQVLALCRWSSWQSTALGADTRFLFLCALSKSGDTMEMIEKIRSKVRANLSFPDSYFLRMINDFIVKPRKPNRTPFLGLPIRFIAIEKDLPLLQMWHIRGDSHATECYIKLCKGLKEEKLFRSERIRALELQRDFLIKATTNGVSQDDFMDLMSKMPSCAYYNHIMFMAFAAISAETLDAGKRQKPTKVCLTNLVSDHNATTINTNNIAEETVTIKPIRVADGLREILHEYNYPPGIHHLINRMSYGQKITNIYAIHPKDSKSKDREIPQMTKYMRPIQFVSESLISIYTDAESTDMMQDPEKYAKFVENFTKIMKKGGLSRSEDKKFFCGNMQPESMSLATLAVAMVTGSTALVTSAAIQRCNRSRWTISPINCDQSIIPPDIYNRKVIFERGNIKNECVASLNYYHMMQGVYGMGAALVNTVYTSGLDLVQRKIMPDIRFSSVMTTSDDSVRGVTVIKNPMYSSSRVSSEYINRGVLMCHHMMMLDSNDKPIRSRKLAEFNNVAVGPNGMFPQQFVHTHLIMQPLIGLNIVDDIITAVSNARMSMTWGDSIDVARSAMAGYVTLLAQKWLLTSSNIDYLSEVGMLPVTDEGILTGFGINNRKIIAQIWSATMPDIKDKVLLGLINPLKALRQFNIKSKNRPHLKLVPTDGLSLPLKRAFDQINASRLIKGRQSQVHFRQASIDKRIAVRDEFMKLMLGDNEISDEEYITLRSLMIKSRAIILPTRPRKIDFKPVRMGNKSSAFTPVNVPSIEAYRNFEVYASDKLNEAEEKIAQLNHNDYEKWLANYKIQEKNLGLEFISPSGLPQMRAINGLILKRPYSFQFMIDTPPNAEPRQGFTLAGQFYPDFTPCWWSDFFLRKAKQGGHRLCLGWATQGKEKFAFFSVNRKDILRRKINQADYDAAYTVVIDKKDSYFCPLKRNFTPINIADYGMTTVMDFTSIFVGDQTAIMNYGNYLNTKGVRAYNLMNRIYKKYGSILPKRICMLKPRYPIFAPDSVKIDMGAVTYFNGYSSICKLQLTKPTRPEPMVKIDLNGKIPLIMMDLRRDDDEEFVD